jgi:ribosome recycling factor
MSEQVLTTLEEKLSKSKDNLKEELNAVRAGRANPALLDRVEVNYYGTPTPINQVAQISVPEARLITISPWEKNMLAPIEKAILKAELGFNPNNDGSIIRITIAPLTKETRVELAKNAKQIAEQAKVAIRNLRRDANEQLKKMLKDHEIAEDQEKKGLDDVQKLTDKFIDEITKIFEKKEKEILEF